MMSLTISGTLADLYDEEEIVLTRKLKDLQDLGKTLTDFSQPFTLPATDVNNGIFEHFYNLDINDPFPVHQKVDATLSVNGIELFVGTLELSSVTLKDLRPDNYEVTFYGRNIQLTTLWGEDTLQDIDFDFDHPLSAAKVKASWAGTLLDGNMTAGDVRYPIADFGVRSDGAFIYNTSAAYPEQNIADSSGSISAHELRPAIRLNRVLENCFSKISKTLTIDSNISDDDLYLLGMESAGGIEYGLDGTLDVVAETISLTGAFNSVTNLTTFTENSDPDNLFNDSTGRYVPRAAGDYTFEIELDNWNAEFFDLEVVDEQGSLRASFRFRSNLVALRKQVKTRFIRNTGFFFFRLVKLSTSNVTLDAINIRILDIKAGIPINETIKVEETLPEVKIKDFIGGVLKTFNAVLLTDNGKDYTLKNLTDYLGAGSTHDYTDKVDTETVIISKRNIPDSVSLQHKESEDIANDNFKAAFGRSFGAVKYDNSGVYDFTSDGIEVESPFSIMPVTLQNISDANGQTIGVTELEIPLFLNAKGEATQVPLSLWYWAGYASVTNEWYFDEGAVNSPSFTKQSSFPFFRPFSALPAVSGSNALGYSYEQDQDGVVPTNTFLTRYWLPHLDRIFNPKMRQVKVKAVLEASDWLNLEMNDSIRIGGSSYKIESVKYNMATKRADLSLYTYNLLTRPTPTFDENGGVSFDDTPSVQDRILTNAKKVGSSFFRSTLSSYQATKPIVRLMQEMSHAMFLLEPRVLDMEITSDKLLSMTTNFQDIKPFDVSTISTCSCFTHNLTDGDFELNDSFLSEIIFTATFANETTKDLEFAVLVNGTETNFKAFAPNGSTEVFLLGFLDLQSEDEVTIGVKKTSSGSANLTITDAEFLIKRAR